jgi:hypothetical protein
VKKLLVLAVLVLAAAGTAAAADFTIRVQVSTSSLPVEVKKAAVNCGAYKVAGSPTSFSWPIANRIGSGLKEFTLTNGGFSGLVEVAFNVDPGSMRTEAHAYVCTLNLMPPSGVFVDCGINGAAAPVCEHAPGMNAAYGVSGPITW